MATVEEARGEDHHRVLLHLLGVICVADSLEAPLVAVFALALDEEWPDEEVYEVLADLIVKHTSQ